MLLLVLLTGACGAKDTITSLDNNQNQPAPIDDSNELISYVAQCEAVLGRIPQISCDPSKPAPGTNVTKIPVFVDGLLLGFDEALSPEEEELLAARATSGQYTCDFPSIGGDFPCSIGSTLVHYQNPENPNVQWVGLCRGVPNDTPSYDRFIGNGLIGANTQTGEMCFFFGQNPDPEQPYELPPLASGDGASEELAPWLAPQDMPGSCISCHPNNDPWILTPWLMPGYMYGTLSHSGYPLRLPADVTLDDVMAARFIQTTPASLQTMEPTPLPEGRTSWTEEEIIGSDGRVQMRQYRIVGSSYVRMEAQGRVKPRTGMRPESWSVNFRDRIRIKPQSESCSIGCHSMGSEYWAHLAADSLGAKLAESYLSSSMQASSMQGSLPGFHWMDPSLQHSLDDVNLTDFSIPAVTECPIPRQISDVPEVRVSCEPIETYAGAVRVTWDYVNSFGAVPDRDDVRFDVAFGNVDSASELGGISATSEREGIAMAGQVPGISVIRDIAPDGDTYQVTLPFEASHEVIRVNLQPKRYCFEEPDRRPYAYAPPYSLEVDIASACEP